MSTGSKRRRRCYPPVHEVDGVRLADNSAAKSSQSDDSGGKGELHDEKLAEDPTRVRKSERGMSS